MVSSIVQLLVQSKLIVPLTFSYDRSISSYDWNNCNICVTLLKFMVLVISLSKRYMTVIRKYRLYQQKNNYIDSCNL